MRSPLPSFKQYLIILAVFVLNECASFFVYLHPSFGPYLFIGLLIAAFFITFRHLENGLLLLIGELAVGGKGYLYHLNVGTMNVSFRIGLFVILFLVLLIRNNHRWSWWHATPSAIRRLIVLLGVAVGWGTLIGIVSRHGIATVFLDANAYVFFAAAVLVLRPQIDWQYLGPRLLAVLAAATTTLGVKSLFSLGIFAHLGVKSLVTYYRWIRNTGVGEIAYINGNAYRVFFQSQIYGLLGSLVLIPFLLPPRSERRAPWWFLFPILFGSTAVLISLSRSFWIGAVVGAIALVTIGISRLHWSIAVILKASVSAFFVLLMSYTLMSWALNFPYPFPPSKGSSTANAIGARFEAVGGGAAVSSRMQMLDPLFRSILREPILGSGFGTMVTYQSSDPRQLESPSRGIFTTDAFEWGYLDIALKIGVIGLSIYLALLYIVLRGLMRITTPLAIGFFSGVSALVAVHITTPYLNHPLGIGFLLFAIALLRTPSAEHL